MDTEAIWRGLKARLDLWGDRVGWAIVALLLVAGLVLMIDSALPRGRAPRTSEEASTDGEGPDRT